MKNLLGFMFGYGTRGNGVLGWNTRLSQPDHLYHQGRNFLSLVIYCLFLLLMMIPISFLYGALSGMTLSGILPMWASVGLMIIGGIILMLPILYLSFAAIKLTILRLHDFSLSGWWILYAVILALADFCFEILFPGSTYFVSIQSLTYLGLLVWPAAQAPNRYGDASVNATTSKPNWIRSVPLLLWVFSWLLGMLPLFVADHFAKQLNPTAPILTTTQNPTPNTQY